MQKTQSDKKVKYDTFYIYFHDNLFKIFLHCNVYHNIIYILSIGSKLPTNELPN